MTDALYSTSEAAKLAGVSAGTVRGLTTGRYSEFYRPFWSPGATSQPRRLTVEDVRLLRYVHEHSASEPHSAVSAQIAAGALEAFDWSPESEPQPPAQDAALVVWQTTAAILQRELSEARQDLQAAHGETLQLAERAAAAEARAEQLAAELERARLPFFRRLFGR